MGTPNHPFFLTAPPLLPHIPSASPRLWSCAPEAAAESHHIPQGSRFGGTPTFGGPNHPFPTETPLLPSLPYAPQNPGLDLQKLLLLLNHIPCPPCPPIWGDPHSLGGDPRPRARRSTLTISAQAGPEAEVPESAEAAARAATPTGPAAQAQCAPGLDFRDGPYVILTLNFRRARASASRWFRFFPEASLLPNAVQWYSRGSG